MKNLYLFLIASSLMCHSLIASSAPEESEKEGVILPSFIFEFGEGYELKNGYIHHDNLHASFLKTGYDPDDSSVINSKYTVSVKPFENEATARANFTNILTSSGETYPSEENYVKYEIGPQFEYGYRDGAVIVKFRTGPFNVTAYLYEARLEDRDEETDILAERLEFKRRIENLNRSLQEWSPEEYYDFVQEHSPAAIRNKSEKRKRPPNPWAGMSLEECMVFLNDKALEDSIRISLLSHLATREYSVGKEDLANLMMKLAETDSHRSTRIRAVKVLETLAWEGSAPYLRGLVDAGPAYAPSEDHSKASEDEQRRAHALDALVEIQGVEALTPLLEKLFADKGERMRLRQTAQVLLKTGSDPE